jgi:hypothetical protein
MIVAYLSENLIDIYRKKKNDVFKLYSGSVENYKHFGFIEKKVLVISRNLTLHTFKKYPKTAIKNLKQIIQLDLDELSPIKNADFAYFIQKISQDNITVAVWFWEKVLTDTVVEKIKPQFVVPEDALFFSNESIEIAAVLENQKAYAVCFGKNGFINSSILKPFSAQSLEYFIKSIGQNALELKKITIYAPGKIQKPDLSQIIIQKQPKAYPVCIDYIDNTNLKTFRTKTKVNVEKLVFFATRLSVYALAAYTINIYLTNKYYTEAIADLKSKISSQQKRIDSLSVNKVKNQYSASFQELNSMEANKINPLELMDNLAKYLPKDTAINYINIVDKNAEMSVTSAKPLDVLKALSQANIFDKVSLSGVPVQDMTKKTFSFTLKCSLK